MFGLRRKLLSLCEKLICTTDRTCGTLRAAFCLRRGGVKKCGHNVLAPSTTLVTFVAKRGK